MLFRLAGLSVIAARAAWDTPPVGVDCFLPLDVVFLQDTTGSFIDDLPNMVKQVPGIVQAIQTSNPGSYFGLMEFRDKPIPTLGETNDFCNKVTSKLSWDAQNLLKGYSTLLASGGSDLPESQLESIIDLVHNTEIGWRPVSPIPSPTNATSGARVIILSTDATPHDPGDASFLNTAGKTYPDYPPTYDGHTSDELCRKYEYPDDLTMKRYLNAANTYLAILTPTDTTSCVNVNIRWHQINEKILGQPADFYQYIRGDSSDALAGVIRALSSITKYVCDITTTPMPTELPATTRANPTETESLSTIATLPTTVATAPTTIASAPTAVPTTATSTPPSVTSAASTPSNVPTTTVPQTSSTNRPTRPTTASNVTPTRPTVTLVSSKTMTDATVTAAGSTQTAASTPSECPTPCPNPCPTPCPNPCPNPCPDPCCAPCVVPPKILVKIADEPSHFAMEIDN